MTTVCAVGHDDIRSGYSDTGANLWVCGPSSSGRVGQPRIATTDNGHRYSGSFGGTSAATPIVSGAVALIREANNALTWRDVKLILAASVRKNDPDNTGWEQGALKYGSTTDRYNFNHEYGFGMVDAKAAVDLAPTWTNVRDLREITSESRVINLRIPDLPSSGTPTTVSSSLTVDHFVEFVEFVEVNAHFNHPYFRDLTVELVSPSGAVSTLSTSAPIEGALTTKFRFGSARHLGENAAGEWTLQIKDTQDGDSGTLKSWGLTFYGHGFVPGAPQIDTVTPGGGTLEIDWNAPTDTGETAITSYDLRYIRDDATDRSDDNWTLETGVGTPTNRSHTITGLDGGVKYEFQLQASNDSGHGPWSQAEADEPTTVAPAAPAITSITRGDRTLAVVWTAPADTGGGVITAYDVRYIETSADEMVDSNWTVRDSAWRSGDLRYVISNLTNATEYDVQVRAVNSAGDGEWSDTETGTPRPPPPPPPPRPSNRPPVFADGPRTDRSIAENTAAGENVGAPVVATDSGILTYMLGGADVGSFGIVAATGQIQVGDGTNLDYEGEKNTYGVEVTATDPSGATAMITVTIAVTNLDEAGTVTLSSEEPTVGDDLTATLGDPDGDLTDVTWQWSKSADMDTWMDIGTGGMYTVMDDDAGHYLRATATYTDGEGMGKMASEETMMVGAMAGDQLLAEYDPNGDGVIEKADMRKAVAKFFRDPPDLTREEMRRLVVIFFR